jgi:hypothetical protein
MTIECKYQKFKEGVEYYSTLKDNWDDEGAIAPTPKHIEMSLLGISKFYNYDIEEPSPMFLADGVIGAYWGNFNPFHVSIDFHADGDFTWGMIVGDKVSSGTWNVNQPVPEVLINILSLRKL